MSAAIATDPAANAGPEQMNGSAPLLGEAPPLDTLPPLAPASQLWTPRIDGAVTLRTSESGPLAEPPVTVHQVLAGTVARFGSRTALAWKEGGEWRTLSYEGYYERCRAAAKSFLKLSLERHHGVAILGFNSAEWVIANIGAIFAGGFGVGIFTTSSPEACQYVAGNCRANVVVVENQQLLEKILEIQDKLPHLKAIIQYRGELKESRSNTFTWAEFMLMGKDVPDAQLDGIIASQRPNQCCAVVYTSGTTGTMKGVMLSHDNLTWGARQAASLLELTHADVAQEVVVSYLPLTHMAGQIFDIWMMMTVGGSTHFAQPDALKGSLADTMREVRPTLFMGVPRVWEKMQEGIAPVSTKPSADSGTTEGMAPSGPPPPSKSRETLGLDRCTKCFTGAAPVSKETLDFFLGLDIRLLDLYGAGECTGPHSFSTNQSFRTDSCGKAGRGCRTKILNPDESGYGEVSVWGRHVFMGYLNMPEETGAALDGEGWVRFGDLGRLDADGFLYIKARVKELITTADGETIPPVAIEDAVKEAVPLVSNAMLVGDQRKFLSMLLTVKCKMNQETGEPLDELTDEAVDLCRGLGSGATLVSQIAGGRDGAIDAAIQDGIARVNERAASDTQRIQKWLVLEREFSVPGGELGPTMKLRRPIVSKMYEGQIDGFYKYV